ncbi:MAG: hypothetical protein IJ168_00070 [Eubacterium sp.]|nr:hypothetical protein [Eubacterium sp.]
MMKRIAIAWLLVIMLTLCACSSQPENEKEGTSGQPEVSSDSGQENLGAVTLATEDEAYEAPAVSFEGESSDGQTTGTTAGNGQSGGVNNNTTTTAAGSNADKQNGGSSASEATTDTTAAASTTESDGVEMPRIPIPHN